MLPDANGKQHKKSPPMSPIPTKGVADGYGVRLRGKALKSDNTLNLRSIFTYIRPASPPIIDIQGQT
jgi:hypothetical protein